MVLWKCLSEAEMEEQAHKHGHHAREGRVSGEVLHFGEVGV